jgi:hypothetical protein
VGQKFDNIAHQEFGVNIDETVLPAKERFDADGRESGENYLGTGPDGTLKSGG